MKSRGAASWCSHGLFGLSICCLCLLNGCMRDGKRGSNESATDTVRVSMLIDSAPSVSGDEYRVAALVRAVNALHALGREKAIASLSTYVEQVRAGAYEHGDEQRAFLITRALFDIPKGG